MFLNLLIIFSSYLAFVSGEVLPCLSKQFQYDSVVCVCDENYCDKIDPSLPQKNQYLIISTSKAGLRFNTAYGCLRQNDINEESLYRSILYNQTTIFKVNRNATAQTIEGFGGAITDSVGYNLNSISKALVDQIFQSYYGPGGLRYNMARTTIAHCDYSLQEYYYDETPYDVNMTDWKLNDADYKYRIPYLKKAKEMALDKLLLVSSIWTVPEWMRELDDSGVKLKVKQKYYSSYCLYIQKFLEAYQKEGLDMYGVSFVNEPTLSMGIILESNSAKTITVWTLNSYIEFARKYFMPMLSKYFNETHFVAFDDSRTIINAVYYQYLKQKNFLNDIKVAGIHSYFDFEDTSASLDSLYEDVTGITILTTEFGSGQNVGVQLGSWDTATLYARTMLQELNHYTAGWVDWNMVLDTNGGPQFSGILTDASIIIDVEKNVFYKQPSFYAMGHFSKFMPRGSVKIGLESKFATPLKYGAVLRPDGFVTAVMYNPTDEEVRVILEDGGCTVDVTIAANSINTLIF